MTSDRYTNNSILEVQLFYKREEKKLKAIKFTEERIPNLSKENDNIILLSLSVFISLLNYKILQNPLTECPEHSIIPVISLILFAFEGYCPRDIWKMVLSSKICNKWSYNASIKDFDVNFSLVHAEM